jgi:hypothetical protein
MFSHRPDAWRVAFRRRFSEDERMTEKRRLDFVFLCDKTFEELDGNDAVVRHCGSCQTDVFDLDAFSDEQLDAFLAAADAAGMELCARLTVRAEPRPCAEYMRPGSYTGRTQASLRRTYARGEPTDIKSFVERHEKSAAAFAKLVAELRNAR